MGTFNFNSATLAIAIHIHACTGVLDLRRNRGKEASPACMYYYITHVANGPNMSTSDHCLHKLSKVSEIENTLKAGKNRFNGRYNSTMLIPALIDIMLLSKHFKP
jgi:hypothetical protein